MSGKNDVSLLSFRTSLSGFLSDNNGVGSLSNETVNVATEVTIYQAKKNDLKLVINSERKGRSGNDVQSTNTYILLFGERMKRDEDVQKNIILL